MKSYKLRWPMILGIIGSIYSVVVGFLIAFLATGGRLLGNEVMDFGRMWLLITIMAIVGPVIGLIGASVTYQNSKVAGVLMLFSVAIYFVVAVLIGRTSSVPYLLLGGIGTLFTLISGVMTLVYPMIDDEEHHAYYHMHPEN